MLGLAFAEAHRFQKTVAEESQQRTGKKRRVRRKKAKPKSLIPPISVAKISNKAERHVARDLYIALRCSWKDERKRFLHRVVLANWEGDCIMDYIIDEGNFDQVRVKIMRKIESKVLIGHGLDYALYSLRIQHPWANMRDGASYLPFMKETADPLTVMFLPRSVSDLMGEILDRTLPDELCPDYMLHEAKGCMDLYRAVRVEWENEITKLLRQKERQREVKLELRQPVQLTSISEDSDNILGGGKAPPITASKNEDKLPYPAEDQLTEAPTEFTHEGEDATISARDDLSVRSKTSDQSIWIPQDTFFVGGNKKSAGTLGLWLPRTAQEGTPPIDANDLLNKDISSQMRAMKLEEPWLAEEESFGHLPSHLLNDSSSEDGSDFSVPVREETSHFVEGIDWLEPDLSLRRSASREKRIGRHNRARQNLGPIVEDTFISRSERSCNRSIVASGELLTSERDASTPMVSFFRKRLSLVEDSPRAVNVSEDFSDGEENQLDFPRHDTESTHPVLDDGLDWIEEKNVGSPMSRFSLFRRKSIEERTAETSHH